MMGTKLDSKIGSNVEETLIGAGEDCSKKDGNSDGSKNNSEVVVDSVVVVVVVLLVVVVVVVVVGLVVVVVVVVVAFLLGTNLFALNDWGRLRILEGPNGFSTGCWTG